MIALPPGLWRDWNLVTQVLVPLLLCNGSSPKVWIGGTVGALTVVTAYHACRPEGSPPLLAFAPPPSEGLTPFTLRYSDIRGFPPPVRSTLYHRDDGQWVADRSLTDRILLGEPDGPVDLVVVPDDAEVGSPGWADPGGEMKMALSRLRRGGHLFSALEPREAVGDGRLEPVPGCEGLYRCTTGSLPGWGQGSGSAGGSPDGSAGGCPDRSAPDAAADGALDTLTRYQERADLVARYGTLARSLARRISNRGESQDDLDQVAYLALIRAAQRFDFRPDVSFPGYATACILGELKRHFRDRGWSMRVPRSIQETYLAVRDTAEHLLHELSRSPTVAEIAERVGITEEAVLEAMEAGSSRWARSLDVGVSEEGDEGIDVPVTEDGFERALERLQLGRAAGRLSPKEAFVLRRIYFDCETQRQAAEDLGVSQMQVSRVLRGALEKLRR